MDADLRPLRRPRAGRIITPNRRRGGRGAEARVRRTCIFYSNSFLILRLHPGAARALTHSRTPDELPRASSLATLAPSRPRTPTLLPAGARHPASALASQRPLLVSPPQTLPPRGTQPLLSRILRLEVGCGGELKQRPHPAAFPARQPPRKGLTRDGRQAGTQVRTRGVERGRERHLCPGPQYSRLPPQPGTSVRPGTSGC